MSGGTARTSSTKTRAGESLLISSSVNRLKAAPLVELFRSYVKGAVKAEPCRERRWAAASVVEHDEGICICGLPPGSNRNRLLRREAATCQVLDVAQACAPRTVGDRIGT